MTFKPEGGPKVLAPVQGGSSFASQHSLELSFGLGTAARGTVGVLWPGGARNRLDNVRAGERLTLPEIPCSFDGDWPSQKDFLTCVRRSLRNLKGAGVLDRSLAARHLRSMLRAYRQEHQALPWAQRRTLHAFLPAP